MRYTGAHVCPCASSPVTQGTSRCRQKDTGILTLLFPPNEAHGADMAAPSYRSNNTVSSATDAAPRRLDGTHRAVP